MAEAYNSAILTYAAEEPDYKDVPRTGHWKPFSGSEEEGEKEEEEVEETSAADVPVVGKEEKEEADNE